MQVRDSNILITGASRGLGAALAEELAARGARVVLCARAAGPLNEVVARIRSRSGQAHALVADIGDKQAIYPLSGAAAALVGPIDVVIHNASTLGPLPMPLLLDTACEDLEQVLAVNLIGPFRLSKVLAGQMALRGRGLLVYISSDAAVSAYPRWGAYGVSKAAADHLSRTFDAELRESGVRSIAIDPGEMDTQMHADAMPEADPAQLQRPADVAGRIAGIIDGALADLAALPEGLRRTAEVPS
jgi:NAD(P)-dependent dehydrogenase (short-subunit alcohol dehydrogenase family)